METQFQGHGNLTDGQRLWTDVGNEPGGRDELIAVLYHRHRSELVRLALAMTGDIGLAEEITQEAFARLLLRWRTLRDQQSAPAYLRRVVINEARAGWRRRQRRELQAMLAAGSPEVAEIDVVEHQAMLAALSQLPGGKRACVLLRFYADLSEAETAATLGVTVGTVKSQTAKGLRQLQRLLEPARTEVS
jgi:RNA polymerase sigma-70 factor (sigma-E family)